MSKPKTDPRLTAARRRAARRRAAQVRRDLSAQDVSFEATQARMRTEPKADPA